MSDTGSVPTDPASPVPLAAPLTGVAAEPDQPAPSEVLPMGAATETGHLVADEDEA